MAFEEYRDLVVTERVDEAVGVVSLRLEDPSGAELPAWEPGSHIDVHLGNDVERQYSLCSRYGDQTWRIAVLREPASRGGSSYVHDSVHAHGGSISAEHGIGQLKREDNARYKSPVELAAMRAIKQALDPRGLMNPGKVL
jgi:ferredoxin-NADP reductase